MTIKQSVCSLCNQLKPTYSKGLCVGCYSKTSYNTNPERKKLMLRLINNYNLNTKKLLISWVGEKKCFYCGNTALPYIAYDFHHINKSEKDFMVGKLPKSMPKLLAREQEIKAELSKCIIVCANCHRTFHSAEYMYNKVDYLNYINKSPFKFDMAVC
jgi:5-methylcytosine-specific restriction endonuclease McrA